MELPVTRGAELDLGAEPSAAGTRDQVVRCGPEGLSLAETADQRVLD